MKWQRRKRNVWSLWGLVLTAIAFASLLYYRPVLTGSNEIDGLIGVCLGLFISSQPAANFLDMLLFEPEFHRWRNWKRSWLSWLALNLLVLLVGMAMIILGSKRFFKDWH